MRSQLAAPLDQRAIAHLFAYTKTKTAFHDLWEKENYKLRLFDSGLRANYHLT